MKNIIKISKIVDFVKKSLDDELRSHCHLCHLTGS